MRVMPADKAYRSQLQRRWSALEITPRLLAGLFCMGMFFGLIAKSWVPGADMELFGGEAAQMDGFVLGHLSSAKIQSDPSASVQWVVELSTNGQVINLKKAN